MERRNHYRILHVQPDAPAEIIRASYRSLMLKLRHHPDRGGSHHAAVTLNGAYRTLSDPERRRAYDRTLSMAQRAPWPRSLTTAIPAGPPEPGHAGRGHVAGDVVADGVAAGLCSFCQAPKPSRISEDSRCACCGGPLTPVSGMLGERSEPEGRRTVPRIGKDAAALIYPAWGRPATRAQMRDLSPAGISLFTSAGVLAGDVVRVVAESGDFIARVVQTRERGVQRSVHAQFLAASFTEQRGVFVSVSA
nr:DnaJ domain-containing protein [Thioalkalivibrio sp.]